jgi:8-oxo-dGTP pyrophosphatase MutT (NUDIX family)
MRRSDGMIPRSEPRPAATVVLVREAAQGIEVLLLLRDRSLAFSPGCWVFPGGKIDPQDYDQRVSAREFHAARRAAVIDQEQLIHTAHWTTPENLPLRFSTWFFLCPLYHPVEVAIDNCEIRDYRWVSPAMALAQVASNELKVIHPTRATLEDLQHYRSLDDTLAGVAGQAVRVVPNNSPYYQPIDIGNTDVVTRSK